MAPSIPQTMKAIQLTGYKKPLELNEVPLPKVGENDLLIKIGAAGWCHTDYQVWEGVYKSETPIIQSHEPVGTIVAMGPKAEKAGKWKIGQRVGYLLFRHQCHTCAACKNYDEIRFCQKADHAGLDADGGMGEYSIGDADNAVLLPDEVPFEQAAPLMCAGATTWGGLERLELPPESYVGIVGIGGLGG
ncbi:Alcohol dehydrogenase [Cyphellophora attinorum]|uniref:Alcohol dehydrogenase n=1 Tax=Cyphellophora attinorum TaxID=1664694 RepID=A0A0N1H849_9EURO|nr:Alcohol dehydrogenase [Phialophora attinorum]KPI42926.1 Alcohol dehydrogenase [Phialophora attinorum]